MEKMKRIEANMRKRCETSKINLRINMVHSVLEGAKLKSKEKEIDAETKLQKYMEELAETADIKCVLHKMIECFNDKAEALEEIELAEKLEKYLNEEVEVEDEKKEKQ